MYTLNFEKKVALINGASRGIGEAIAKGIADCGAQLIITGRKQETIQNVADEIIKNGGKAHAAVCHAGKISDIKNLISLIRDKFGQLDILINNAATNPYYGPAAENPIEAFNKTVEVNLQGPYFFMSEAIPLMTESGGGSIVNVASIAALRPAPGQAVYAMTKAGLVSVTKSFANEYGKQGIRVNAILPGVIDTRFAKALVENPSIQKWLSKIPAGRVGQPNDMVAGVLYLVSDDAAYTTGTTLVMDGGACIR